METTSVPYSIYWALTHCPLAAFFVFLLCFCKPAAYTHYASQKPVQPCTASARSRVSGDAQSQSGAQQAARSQDYTTTSAVSSVSDVVSCYSTPDRERKQNELSVRLVVCVGCGDDGAFRCSLPRAREPALGASNDRCVEPTCTWDMQTLKRTYRTSCSIRLK